MSSIVWMTTNKKKPRILITSGEPAGIGPDLVIKLAQLKIDSDITVIADPELIADRAHQLSLKINVISSDVPEESNIQSNQKSLKVLPVKLHSNVLPGKLDQKNATYVLNMLDLACDACISKKFDAMVTAPVQKSIINDAGITFSGHTEYLAKRCGEAHPVMLLSCPGLRIALVTTHVPLRDVADMITQEILEKVLHIVIEGTQRFFNIKKPTITVCGLNPHAGENGHLGQEEQTKIIPVIKQLQKQGHNIIGPVPADTAFRPEQRKLTDVFVCMYHDQGLPVLKTLGFGEAVNITLGLPIIRTSVDHGTALELAGTGKANCDSLLAAIEMAEVIALNQMRSRKTIKSDNNIIDECR